MSSPCEAKGVVNVWCGYCYANIRGRASFKGHRGYRPKPDPVVENLAMALKKRVLTPEGSTGKMMPGKMGLACPHLFEHLTLTAYDDGTERVPSTLTIFLDGQGFKACLNDRDQGLTAFYFAESLDGLFSGLEKALAADTLTWKANGQGAAQKKKPKKAT